MSRESTPASLFGGLAISGSPSSTDMPVTTRGMRNRRHSNLAASHQASTGAAAGPSQTGGSPSVRQVAGRSRGRATNPPANRRRPAPGRRTNDDSDDEDAQSDDDDDSGEENFGQVVREIMATLADTYPTPQEFARINLQNTRNVSGNEQT